MKHQQLIEVSQFHLPQLKVSAKYDKQRINIRYRSPHFLKDLHHLLSIFRVIKVHAILISGIQPKESKKSFELLKFFCLNLLNSIVLVSGLEIILKGA